MTAERLKYPRLGLIVRNNSSNGPGRCACCVEPAYHTARVEFSYLAGDDGNYPVCQRHIALASSDVKSFLSRVRITK